MHAAQDDIKMPLCIELTAKWLCLAHPMTPWACQNDMHTASYCALMVKASGRVHDAMELLHLLLAELALQSDACQQISAITFDDPPQ